MPRSATATGSIHDISPQDHSEPIHNSHWLSDPTQLSHWQAQLFDCCDAINLQLSQIRHELASHDNLHAAPASLRLVNDQETF